MKTILLVSPYWKEKHRWMVSSYKLAELWQRMGYRVVVACMGASSGKDAVSPTLTIYRKKDFFLPDPWNYGIAMGFSGFVRHIVREEKPDIVVANKILFWSSFCVILLRLRGIRATLITDTLVGITWWPRDLIPKICAAIYAWTGGWLIMLCAERIVFFHPQPERLLHCLWVAHKSVVIPTGIDVAPYRPAQDIGQRTSDIGSKKEKSFSVLSPTSPFDKLPPSLSSYGRAGRTGSVRSPEVVVTYVGRLESVKGVDDFLAAVVPLKDHHTNIHIRVVGWHPDRHPLVAQYNDKVEFMGLRDDIPAILATTDIFVLPSYSEGLSNALMEAMVSGCAVIASDVGGNAYLIQNGISGLLFPASDREALRSHIQRLIQDPAKRRAMGEAARKRIQEQCSWDVVAKEYERLFEGTGNWNTGT